MNTYLFTWNPTKWEWLDLNHLIAQLPHNKPTRPWATVSTKNIGKGDRFILIKIGPIPQKDKGIIGIGTIISSLYKDKDFLRNDRIRPYVTLEFEQLSNQPFFYLNELEDKYPNQKWTPEGSGVLIKEPVVANEIFKNILHAQSILPPNALFEKKIFFPIVSEIIDVSLSKKSHVHRDEIVQKLLENHYLTVDKIAKNSNKDVLFIAQNMVDWFSAELTKKSEIAAPWLGIYSTSKIKIDGREITNYSWVNHPQDEVIPDNTLFKEGTLKQIQVNAYERNPKARQKCLDKFGYNCQCCTFNFEKIYGELGKNFIHVHHITPLSFIKNEYVLNPENDLIPVCANCHAMIHRKVPPYTIEEIQALLNPS